KGGRHGAERRRLTRWQPLEELRDPSAAAWRLRRVGGSVASLSLVHYFDLRRTRKLAAPSPSTRRLESAGIVRQWVDRQRLALNDQLLARDGDQRLTCNCGDFT